tara:strand:- start:84 stop:515 length:432 start_codon:yes stop_codon:yes gene_type:complete
MIGWITDNWKTIGVVGTSVAFAGALIGWHYVSLIPEASGDLKGLFAMSCIFTGFTITYFLMRDDWRWKQISIMDRPLPVLASFVIPMFLGTWQILWNIPEYLLKKECNSKSTYGNSYVWRDDYCWTPEEWRLRICEKHPTTCD